jgi:tetratricopeptide (TPR) repeat protein
MKAIVRKVMLVVVLLFVGCQFFSSGYCLDLIRLDFSLMIDPGNTNALYNRAFLRTNAWTDNQGAINDLNRLTELQPNDSTGYFQLGDLYRTLGDKKKSIENFQKAAKNALRNGNKEQYEQIISEIKFVNKLHP